jgi:hypothetical protein
MRCPYCNQHFAVTRPDSMHPCWSFEKPAADSVDKSVIEQTFECGNPQCGAKFTIYWFDSPLALNLA